MGVILLRNYFVGTTKGVDFIPILHDVRLCLKEAQLKEGLVTISIPAEGASLTIAQAKNTNGATHRSLSLPFQGGELLLAPKQMIYLVDQGASGKRREFYVQVMGEKEGPPPRGGPRRTSR